jgi:hydroxymethylpyrimidine pyrophosphatase-like HAD family hydrolase
MEKKNTYFCDIDGTIFKYRKFETYETTKAEGIKSTIDYLDQAASEGHMIILTTARP